MRNIQKTSPHQKVALLNNILSLLPKTCKTFDWNKRKCLVGLKWTLTLF